MSLESHTCLNPILSNIGKNVPERRKISTVWTNFCCYYAENISLLSFSRKVDSSRGVRKCNCWSYLPSTWILLFYAIIKSETFTKIQVKEIYIFLMLIHLTPKCRRNYRHKFDQPAVTENQNLLIQSVPLLHEPAISKGFSHISFESFLVEFEPLLLMATTDKTDYFFIFPATAFI